MGYFPKRSVVVPVDFSDASFEAVGVARELVTDGSQLHVVNVLPALHPGEPGMVFEDALDQERVMAALDELKKRLADERFRGIDIVVRVGHPGNEIVAVAEEVGAELVVMPSHGRHGVQRLLLGSVTERVLRTSSCPVLVLRRES